MSVDYDAFLGIGRRFGNKNLVERFLQAQQSFTDKQVEELLDTNWCEYTGCEIKCLDSYNGDDWFVGFSVSDDSPSTLENSVRNAVIGWEQTFPDNPARVVWAVIYS